MADYIPSDDASLATFAANMVSTLDGNEADYGVTGTNKLNLESATLEFSQKLSAHNSAQSSARSARVSKDDSRAFLVKELRGITKIMQAAPVMTDAKRATLGITIPDTIPTAVSAPSSRPVVAVDTANRLVHKVKFTDELTPFSNAKPSGALGCEIYVKIGGDAPVSLDECKFLGVATKTPYEVSFNAEDGGKLAHYLARWATRSGLTGATSQLTSATIVA